MPGPAISVQFLRHVANCLELTGCLAEPLLGQFGLCRGDLDDHEGLIPLADFMAFLDAAARQARNPHFGLHAGRLAGSDSLGPLSFLFLSAPTLRDAFTSFTRFLDTMQEGSRDDFVVDRGWGTFSYAVIDQSLPFRRQDAEYSLGATFTLARQFTSAELTLTEVRFEHEMVGDYSRYRDYFGCDVFFEQDVNSFSFDAAYLAAKGQALSSALHPIIVDHLQHRARDRQANSGLIERLRAMLTRIPLDESPSLTTMARRFGISAATLRRRLRAAGVSWRQLVAERRMATAGRLLRDSQRNIADIALAVGYAESASFIRGFRRHFGMTPQRYRHAAHNHGGRVSVFDRQAGAPGAGAGIGLVRAAQQP